MKKTLAIFSLTSCEGCQFEMLNHFESFGKLLDFFDLKNFRLGQGEQLDGPFDVAVIEGSVEDDSQIKFLRDIRRHSEVLIALGTCAHLGGIQSERNSTQKMIDKKIVRTIPNTIKVDYILPGCPINHDELYHCLMDIYWGKVFTLPDLAVCFECRQNNNECLIKQGKPCLGPITRMGCNSVCINNGEACLGCRDTIPEANIKKLKQVLGLMISEKEIENTMNIYGKLDKSPITKIQ